MPLRRTRPWFRLAPLALGMAVLVGLAPLPVNRADNFDDNSIASFWQVKSFGNARVREVNQRLEFRTIGPSAPLSAAGLRYKRDGIDWTQDFHIEWRSRFKFAPLTSPNQRCFMGTVLVIEGQYPNTMTGLGCGYLKDISGEYFGIVEFTNGAITNVTGTVVPSTQLAGGFIRIDWNAGIDRITATHEHPPTDGYGPYVPYFGFDAAYGDTHRDLPMTIVQGVLLIGDSFSITGNKVYMDRWKATFTPRAFP